MASFLGVTTQALLLPMTPAWEMVVRDLEVPVSIQVQPMVKDRLLTAIRLTDQEMLVRLLLQQPVKTLLVFGSIENGQLIFFSGQTIVSCSGSNSRYYIYSGATCPYSESD